MAKSNAARVTKPSGSIITRHLEGNIIESVYQGQISFDSTLNDDLVEQLNKHPGANWLVDATGATGIDPGRRDNAGNTIQLFREKGGGSIAAVIAMAPIRMVASALSFGFDLRLKIFATREEALTYLRSLKR